MLPYSNPHLPPNPLQWQGQPLPARPHAHQEQQTMQGGPAPVYYNQGYHSSHYMQAYMRAQQPGWGQVPPAQFGLTNPSTYRPQGSTSFSKSRPPPAPMGSWYQPGTERCTYKGCSFTGSHSSVEIHMMDRHLIYPPGWDKRPKKQDWDADPSLKGKPIPIQGTNVTLDDPETLAKWIAERKKRFPTADKVAEKKRKMDEAVARGQLTEEDMGLRPDKRRKGNNHPNDNGKTERGRGGRGRGRGRGGGVQAQSEPRPAAALPPKPTATPEVPPLFAGPLPPNPTTTASSNLDDYGSSSSDSEGEPEVVSSKRAVEESEPPARALEEESVRPKPESTPLKEMQPQQRKRPPLQPKNPPKNPFASRPTLLRNLIAPEIRMTVSNLSQAIRFLVDNDFLQGVELNPGDASNAPIQVLSSASIDDSASHASLESKG